MQQTRQLAPHVPCGLAFPLEELAAVQAWATWHGKIMALVLDRVMDGAEFEEMIFLTPAAGTGEILSLWRTAAYVVAQKQGEPPLRFQDVHAALAR